MKKKKQNLKIWIFFSLIILILTGCISVDSFNKTDEFINNEKTIERNEKKDIDNKSTVEIKTLKLITSNLPPFAIESSANGIAVDFAREIAKKANMEFSVEFQPWARAQETVRAGKNLVILPLGNSAEREDNFNWIGIAMNYDVSFFSINDKAYDLETAKSLNSVLVQQNTTFETFLQENNFRNINGTTDTDSNGKMLAAARGDAWFVSEWEGIWIWKESKLEGNLTIGPPAMNTIAWLAISKDSDKEFEASIKKAFDEVVEENILEIIVKDYIK